MTPRRRFLSSGLLSALLAAGLRAQDKPADASAAKSSNWLVDAMEGENSTAPARNKTSQSASDTGFAAQLQGGESKLAKSTVNPLSSYLETWLSPQDLALMKTRESDARAPGVADATGSDLLGASRAPALTRKPNPYLPESAPAVVVQAKVPPPKPPASLAGTVSPPQKTEVTAAKTTVTPAEVKKAEDDAKYFPQLKRF